MMNLLQIAANLGVLSRAGGDGLVLAAGEPEWRVVGSRCGAVGSHALPIGRQSAKLRACGGYGGVDLVVGLLQAAQGGDVNPSSSGSGPRGDHCSSWTRQQRRSTLFLL